MVNDGYTETSGVLKGVYFDGKAMQGDYGFLSDAEDVLFAGNCFDGGYATLYNECIRQGKRTYSKLNDYVGELYVCLWQWHDKALAELDGVKNLYAWCDGKIQPYAIEDKIIIKRNIPIPTMKEFVEENFDNSEVNEHNQYSAVAKSVE